MPTCVMATKALDPLSFASTYISDIVLWTHQTAVGHRKERNSPHRRRSHRRGYFPGLLLIGRVIQVYARVYWKRARHKSLREAGAEYIGNRSGAWLTGWQFPSQKVDTFARTRYRKSHPGIQAYNTDGRAQVGFRSRPSGAAISSSTGGPRIVFGAVFWAFDSWTLAR